MLRAWYGEGLNKEIFCVGTREYAQVICIEMYLPSRRPRLLEVRYQGVGRLLGRQRAGVGEQRLHLKQQDHF